ncbi:hypothetical protein [Cyanobium sp. Lug-B]|uniref:hypothetical protein n=1 Tax=Cyanobium sp. Lug-B TaxID=2823716 RepID=UPI0020CF3B7D|nr:hypothetical protein [Cyanobium sp. Lug-B]MCP9796672.1 hypothetical protein [Cyanobium sp. Lug-B]
MADQETNQDIPAMPCLPSHGRVDCKLCFEGKPVVFDTTKRSQGDWRITNNPLAWGSSSPNIVVLGFSKGPRQAGSLASTAHDVIAFKGSRGNVAKILAHLGLLPGVPMERGSKAVDELIADPSGRFHFGSLVRCTVERFDRKSGRWKGSGGGMLDQFVALPFGHDVATRCAIRFLSSLPEATKLIVMFGLGTGLNYVDAAMRIFRLSRPGKWRKLNDVSYTDGRVVVVHVEHFAAQGALIPDWLGLTGKPRARLGRLAQESVLAALGRGALIP